VNLACHQRISEWASQRARAGSLRGELYYHGDAITFDPVRWGQPAMIVVEPDISIPDEELEFTYVRASGPGGQNVNKVNSKAAMRWPVTASLSLPDAVRARFLAKFATRITKDGELILTSQRFRDQRRNADDCLEKLRDMLLAVARPPKRRRPTRPSRAAEARRRQGKSELSQKKQGRRLPREE